MTTTLWVVAIVALVLFSAAMAVYAVVSTKHLERIRERRLQDITDAAVQRAMDRAHQEDNE